MKKLLIILILIALVLPILGINNNVSASVRITGIEQFPASYQPYLRALAAKYPNWTFTAMNTGLNWNTVLYYEYEDEYHARNLVQGRSGDWICSVCGYKVKDGSDWYHASYAAIAYMMDPRNFLTEEKIFQFENLKYVAGTYSLEVIENILEGSFMHNSIIDLGTKKYSQVILEAGNEAQINPYHIAARMRQEIGATRSNSVTGTYPGKEGRYNYFNIGATGGDGAIGRGLDWAVAGTEYGKPWNTPEKSIKGGAAWLESKYIYWGQDTLYLQKYDVEDSDGDLYWYQYMANIEAALYEGQNIYYSYRDAGKLSNAINFVIPVFNGMPSIASPRPGTASVYTETVYINDTYVNIRNAPGTSGTMVVTQANTGDRFVRIERAVIHKDGYSWDKIVLPNGTKAYVVTDYLSTINPKTGKGETYSINETVYVKEDGISVRNGPGFSNTTIITAYNKNQKLTRIEQSPYYLDGSTWDRVVLPDGQHAFVESKYLSTNVIGTTPPPVLDPSVKYVDVKKDDIARQITAEVDTTVESLKAKYGSATGFKNAKGQEITTGNLGTGSKVTIDGVEYTIIKLGDIDGDGLLTASDLILLRRNILNLEAISDDAKKAGNISGNGAAPSAGDLVRMVRQILGLEAIKVN